ncbi:MAG: hypothetical protein ACRDIF_05500 [Actinomycetota bacterium]
MTELHRAVGAGIVAGFLVLLVWGAVAAAMKRGPGGWFWRLLAAMQGALILQMVAGVVLLAIGFRQPLLHYGYGALFPGLVLAGAHLFARGMPKEADAAKVFTLASFFVVALLLRAFITGMGLP